MKILGRLRGDENMKQKNEAGSLKVMPHQIRRPRIEYSKFTDSQLIALLYQKLVNFEMMIATFNLKNE